MRTQLKSLRSLFAATLLATASTAALAADPIPLSIFVSPEGLFGEVSGDTYSYKLIGDATGVRFDITQGIFENEAEKLSTIFASGDLPDIISLRSEKWVDDLGPRGLFVALDEYIAAGKMPNLQAQMEKRGLSLEEITSSDGHIYRAPQFLDILFIPRALLVRADLLQECGIIADKNNPGPGDVIKTPDDLYNALACEKEKLGGPVIAAREGYSGFLPKWANWFGTSVNQYHNPATNTFEYGPLMGRYRAMTEFFARLYADGILNPDYATLTDAEWSAIHDSGKGGAALENIGWNYNRLRDKGIDPGKDFFVQSLTIDGERIQWPWPSQIRDSAVLVISAKSSPEEIEAAVRVIDFLYSDEGVQLPWYGQQGIDWQVGPDGKNCFTGNILFRPHAHGYCDGKVPETTRTFITESLLDANPLYRVYGYGWKGSWSGVDNPDIAPNRWNEVLGQFEQGGSMTNPTPRIALNQDEVGIVAQVGTALDTYVMEETQRFIEGTRPLNDEEWAAFQAEVEGFGAQQVVDVYNAALARQ